MKYSRVVSFCARIGGLILGRRLQSMTEQAKPRLYGLICWSDLGGCGQVTMAEKFEKVCPHCHREGTMTPMVPCFF